MSWQARRRQNQFSQTTYTTAAEDVSVAIQHKNTHGHSLSTLFRRTSHLCEPSLPKTPSLKIVGESCTFPPCFLRIHRHQSYFLSHVIHLEVIFLALTCFGLHYEIFSYHSLLEILFLSFLPVCVFLSVRLSDHLSICQHLFSNTSNLNIYYVYGKKHDRLHVKRL